MQRSYLTPDSAYRELPAEPALALEVACVWYDSRLRPAAEHRSQLVLPDGCIDIVWVRGRAPLVAGPATLPARVALPPRAAVIGLRFRPGGAAGFLGVPAHELLNAEMPLRAFWGDAADRLHDELESASSVTDALAVLEAGVHRRAAAPADALVLAASRLLRRHPQRTITDLGDTLGLSQRQLLRRFTASVGYGPRTLARVLRFRRFVRLLSDARTGDWDLSQFAAECGFADHAHLARDCASFAGLSPSQLRQLWAPSGQA